MARAFVLSDAAEQVLRAAVVDPADRTLTLTGGQLDRKVYVEVNEVLERLGGKWNRSKRAHVFEANPADALATVLESGAAPEKNPEAFFATPALVVERLLDLARIDRDGLRILEPSAGDGAILTGLYYYLPACDRTAEVLAVELHPARAEKARRTGFLVLEGDFLTMPFPEAPFDRVVMNPPFAVAGDAQAYITHIEHAFTLLRPGGRLVSVAPMGFTFRKDKRSAAFLSRVGYWEPLPVDAFRESGTGVRCALLVMEKAA